MTKLAKIIPVLVVLSIGLAAFAVVWSERSIRTTKKELEEIKDRLVLLDARLDEITRSVRRAKETGSIAAELSADVRRLEASLTELRERLALVTDLEVSRARFVAGLDDAPSDEAPEKVVVAERRFSVEKATKVMYELKCRGTVANKGLEEVTDVVVRGRCPRCGRKPVFNYWFKTDASRSDADVARIRRIPRGERARFEITVALFIRSQGAKESGPPPVPKGVAVAVESFR